MTRRQRSPFGELVFAHRTARNLTREAMATDLAEASARSGLSGTVSERTLANVERQYGPNDPWSSIQQATVDILAEYFGYEEGSAEWSQFQAAAHTTRTIASATRREIETQTFVGAGRESQLARIDHALNDVARGHNGVLLLAAEGGAGKTTLLLHACRRAVERHANLAVLWGECTTQHLPFEPFTTMTSASLTLQEHASSEHVVSALNQLRLRERLPVALGNLASEGQVFIDRFVPIDNIDFDKLPTPLATTLSGRESAGRIPTDEQDFLDQSWKALTSYARSGPTVLVLDNLHLATEETVSLLLDIVRRLRGSFTPVLILGSYRPFDLMPTDEAPAPPFAQALPEIGRLFYAPVVNLETAIGGKAGRAYVEALLASRVQDAPESLADDVMSLTDGLPLFVEAVLRWYQQGEEREEVTPAAPLLWNELKATLPSEIGGVFNDLFMRLPERHRVMLQAASVQGATFSADVLQRVLAMARSTLIEELVDYLGKGANLVETAGSRIISNQKSYDYRFFHSQMADFIYRQIDAETLRDLHRATAIAMIDLWGVDTHNGAQLIARHLEHGGQPVEAGRWYLRAGDFHLFRHEHRQSAPFFQRVVDLGIVDDDPFVVAQAQVGLGNCARGLGNLPMAERLLTEARETAREHDAPLAEANALTSHGMVEFDLGNMEGAATRIRAAISILRHLDDHVEVCRATALLSHAVLAQGLLDAARETSDDATRMAAALGHDGLYVQALVAKMEYLLAMGKTQEAIDVARRGYEIADDLGDSHRMALCSINLAMGLLEIGRPDEAQRAIDRLFTLRQVINGRMLGSGLFVRGLIQLDDGQFEEAEQSIRDSLAMRRRHHQHALAIENLVALLQIATGRRDDETVARLAEEVRAALGDRGPDGIDEPFALFLALIDAGELLEDGEMVAESVEQGQAVLLERASGIANEDERRQYLSGRRSHRRLMSYYPRSASYLPNP